MHDSLHGFGDEFQVALVSDLKFYLVPNVGKQRPRIIPDYRVEYFRIRKLDDPPAGMIARDKLSAKLPKGSVEIPDVDDISGGITDFDAISYAERLPDQQINPPDKTGHGCLDGQTQNDRADSKSSERSVPVNEDHRDGDHRD